MLIENQFTVDVDSDFLWHYLLDVEKIAPWIEFNTAQTPLFTGDFQPSGEEWAQIAVAGFLWLVVPLVLGTMRLLRIEFK